MKLYTKTGDEGTTGLIGGTRVEKDDVRLEAYGTVDELNANIGLLVSLGLSEEQQQFLQAIQNLLFTIGSNLATDTSKTALKSASVFGEKHAEWIENEIDQMDGQLTELKNFILPGGSVKAAQCHICRTVARRAERRIIEMNRTFTVDKNILVFINRLSDYFFALSRLILKEENLKEIAWKPLDK
jgi:cob(I)alamin adenosyltransferase